MTEDQTRAAAIRAAIALDYPDAEKGKDGKPHVGALNDRIEPGLDAVTAKERDAAWENHLAEAEGERPAMSETPETVAERHDNPERAPNDAETADQVQGDDPEAAAIEPELEAPETDKVSVTVIKAAMSPVPLYVHGVGRFSLPIDKAVTVPREALDALDNSDVQYSYQEL